MSYCKHCEYKKRIEELEHLHADALEETLISDREIKRLNKEIKHLENRNKHLKDIILELNASINKLNANGSVIEEIYTIDHDTD